MNDSFFALSNNSNLSSASSYCKYEEPDTDMEENAKKTAFALLSVLGIILNIFIIVLATKYTVRKNLHHLIINMAVSDALFLFVFFLYHVPWLSNDKWSIYPSGIVGVVICKTMLFLLYISYRVSLFTLLVISIERFRATRRILQRSPPYTLKQRVAVLGVCWLIPMTTSVCEAIAVKPYDDFCDLSVDFFKTNLIVTIFMIVYEVLMVIVCFVIFALSILTIRRLSKPQVILTHLSEEQRHIRVHRTQAAVSMVLVSVLLYICCWLPMLLYWPLGFVDIAIPSVKLIDFSLCIDWKSLFYICFDLLPIVNSCFSPCIYIIFLSDFREAAKKVLCRRETLNQAANRRNSIEMQPMANPLTAHNRRRNSDEQ